MFDKLPKGVIPYVFPLFVEEPDKFFRPLKNHGVPVIRFGEFLWKGMDVNICSVSASLSKRVFSVSLSPGIDSGRIGLDDKGNKRNYFIR